MKIEMRLSDQVRERFLQAQREVYRVMADVPEEEVEALVVTAVTESRHERIGKEEPPVSGSG